MAPTHKVLNSPDKDQIIERLTRGESVRDVSAWLASKYPLTSQRHLRISYSSLQQFKKEYLNISGRVLQDIKDAERLTQESIRKDLIQEEVQSTNAYQEAIQSIVDERLDVQRELVEVFHILKARIEFFYNKLQSQEFSDKQEKAFQKYLDQSMKAMEDYKKYVEGYRETTEHNINVNIMTNQVGKIREAVREVLADMDPEIAVKFMGNLNEKMRDLPYEEHALYLNDVQVS